VVEEEFLAHIVLPNCKGTVGDWLIPQIDKAHESGKMARYCWYGYPGDYVSTLGSKFRI
jgi:hypothetical protein